MEHLLNFIHVVIAQAHDYAARKYKHVCVSLALVVIASTLGCVAISNRNYFSSFSAACTFASLKYQMLVSVMPKQAWARLSTYAFVAGIDFAAMFLKKSFGRSPLVRVGLYFRGCRPSLRSSPAS